MCISLINQRYPDEINSRIARLEAITPLVLERVHLPHTDVALEVMRPESIDPLLETVEQDPEFNLPYWAEIWPSGIALASAILREPEIVRSTAVIELGCGIGITAAAAIIAGANLTATDYSPHSLILTELTCLLAGQRLPEVRQINWREGDADVLQSSGQCWPVVLAADVLYEARDIEPMLAVLERMVAPGGMVWLAAPGRAHAHTAIERARMRGWDVNSTLDPGPWLHTRNADVHLYKLRKPPGID